MKVFRSTASLFVVGLASLHGCREDAAPIEQLGSARQALSAPTFYDDFADESSLANYVDHNPVGSRSVSGGRLEVENPGNAFFYQGTASGVFLEIAPSALGGSPIAGDFLVQLDLAPHAPGNPEAPPAGNFRVAGIMARSVSDPSDWIFPAFGRGAGGVLGAQVLSTADGQSDRVDELDGVGYRGSLRLCRVGNEFRAYRRLDASAPWERFDSLPPARPDLAGPVALGIALGAFQAGSAVAASIDSLRVGVPASVLDCEGDFGVAPSGPGQPLFATFVDDFDYVDAADFAARSTFQNLNPGSNTLRFEDGQMVIRQAAGSAFWDSAQGSFLHRPASGNFVLSVSLAAHAPDDEGQPPTGNFRVIGLMAQSQSRADDWVFPGVGAGLGGALGAQHISTDDGDSVRTDFLNGAVSGELRLCRVGSELRAFRLLTGDADWVPLALPDSVPGAVVGGLVRGDLGAVNVGIALNAFGPGPQLEAHVDAYAEAVPASLAECTRPIVTEPPSSVSANIVASRTHCVSPCTIEFSSEGTLAEGRSASQVFGELGYHWDFDDPSSGTWSTIQADPAATITGQSRNEMSGTPIAAHTFRCETGQCVFRVALRAQDGPDETALDLRRYDDAFIDISVDAPTIRHDAAHTVCVSALGDFEGCPAGATQRTAAPAPREWSGLRVLFHRGETFPGICIDYRDHQVLVESYGSSLARAELGQSFIGVNGACNVVIPNDADILASYPARWAEEITLHGLRLPILTMGMSYHQVDLVDLDMDYESAPIGAPGGLLVLASSGSNCVVNPNLDCALVPYPRGMYVVDSEIVGTRALVSSTTNPTLINVNVAAVSDATINWWVLLGNYIGVVSEHNVRVHNMWRGIAAYNTIPGEHHRPNGRGKISVRSSGTADTDPEVVVHRVNADDTSPDLAPGSHYNVLQRNILGREDDTFGASQLSAGASAGQSPGVSAFVIVDRNHFISGCNELPPLPCGDENLPQEQRLLIPGYPGHPSRNMAFCGHDLYCRTNSTGDTRGPRTCALGCTIQDPADIFDNQFEQVPPAIPALPSR